MKKLDKIEYEVVEQNDKTAYKFGNFVGYSLLLMIFIIIGVAFVKFILWLAGL